jgi:GTP cyclohydrolase II
MNDYKVVSAKLPTQWANFELYAFDFGSEHHLALALGDIGKDSPVLTRIHSECLTGDAFSSLRCDCRSQLENAMEMIAKEGSGLLIYLRQEGRGIGIVNKVKAYRLQDSGADTVEANISLGLGVDNRSYGVCKSIFDYFGINSIRLITNNPDKIESVRKMGINVAGRPMIF